MFIYIVKVFENDYSSEEAAYENGRSWEQLGAFISLNKALEKAKSYIDEDLALYKDRDYDIAGAAEEITTALKIVLDYPIKYIKRKDWDKEIEIERLKVEE